MACVKEFLHANKCELLSTFLLFSLQHTRTSRRPADPIIIAGGPACGGGISPFRCAQDMRSCMSCKCTSGRVQNWIE